MAKKKTEKNVEIVIQEDNQYDASTVEAETNDQAEEKVGVLSKIGTFFRKTGTGIWDGIKWMSVGKTGKGGIWGAMKWMAVGKGEGGIKGVAKWLWKKCGQTWRWLVDASHSKDVTMNSLFIGGGVMCIFFPPVGLVMLGIGAVLMLVKCIGLMADAVSDETPAKATA